MGLGFVFDARDCGVIFRFFSHWMFTFGRSR